MIAKQGFVRPAIQITYRRRRGSKGNAQEERQHAQLHELVGEGTV